MDAPKVEPFCGQRGCALDAGAFDAAVKEAAEGAAVLCPTCCNPLQWREVSQEKLADNPAGHGGDVDGDDVSDEDRAAWIAAQKAGGLPVGALITAEGGAHVHPYTDGDQP